MSMSERKIADEARASLERDRVEALGDEYRQVCQREDPAGKRRTREVAAALRKAGGTVPAVPRETSDGKTTR